MHNNALNCDLVVCRRWRLLSLQFWSSIRRLQICNGMGNRRC